MLEEGKADVRAVFLAGKVRAGLLVPQFRAKYKVKLPPIDA